MNPPNTSLLTGDRMPPFRLVVRHDSGFRAGHRVLGPMYAEKAIRRTSVGSGRDRGDIVFGLARHGEAGGCTWRPPHRLVDTRCLVNA